MSEPGSSKAFYIALFIIVVAVAALNWQSTFFVLKFLRDLVVIDAWPLLDRFQHH